MWKTGYIATVHQRKHGKRRPVFMRSVINNGSSEWLALGAMNSERNREVKVTV